MHGVSLICSNSCVASVYCLRPVCALPLRLWIQYVSYRFFGDGSASASAVLSRTSCHFCAFRASMAASMGFDIFLEIFAFLPAHSGACAFAGVAEPMPMARRAATTVAKPNRFDTSDAPYKRAAVFKAAARVLLLL